MQGSTEPDPRCQLSLSYAHNTLKPLLVWIYRKGNAGEQFQVVQPTEKEETTFSAYWNRCLWCQLVRKAWDKNGMAPRTGLEAAATAAECEAGVQLHLGAHSQVFWWPEKNRDTNKSSRPILQYISSNARGEEIGPQDNRGAHFQFSPPQISLVSCKPSSLPLRSATPCPLTAASPSHHTALKIKWKREIERLRNLLEFEGFCEKRGLLHLWFMLYSV